MTDGADDLTGASEARERARRLLTKAAQRRAAEPTSEPEPAAEAAPGPLERIGGLHDLLRDTAAYLGDRPSKDAEANALYGRVMRVLGEGGE
jgi:hypothetical protein